METTSKLIYLLKKDYIIPAFQKLSTMIGKDRVIWRYDPILFSEKYTMDHHVYYFRALADKLSTVHRKIAPSVSWMITKAYIKG